MLLPLPPLLRNAIIALNIGFIHAPDEDWNLDDVIILSEHRADGEHRRDDLEDDSSPVSTAIVNRRHESRPFALALGRLGVVFCLRTEGFVPNVGAGADFEFRTEDVDCCWVAPGGFFGRCEGDVDGVVEGVGYGEEELMRCTGDQAVVFYLVVVQAGDGELGDVGADYQSVLRSDEGRRRTAYLATSRILCLIEPTLDSGLTRICLHERHLFDRFVRSNAANGRSSSRNRGECG